MKDEGEMLLLGGFILVFTFVSAAIVLTMISDVEKKTNENPGKNLAEEFRFIRSGLKEALRNAVVPQTTNETFLSQFKNLVDGYRSSAHDAGLEVTLILGNSTSGVPRNESYYVVNGTYGKTYGKGLHSFDNARNFTGARFDGRLDGLLWTTPPVCAGRTPPGCLSGAIIYIFLTDGVGAVEETVVYALNV